MFINDIIKTSLAAENAGEDLSMSAALLELESMAKPVRALNSDGKRLTDDDSEHEPSWAAVEKRCVELLGKSRDLRVAVFYVAALLRVQGIAGLAQGLYIIKKLLSATDYQAYPQLDSSDSIVERWYTVAALSAPYKRDGDLLRIIEGIRTLPLVRKNSASFSYRDVLAAKYKSGGADLTALERMKAEWRSNPAEDRALVADWLSVSLSVAGEIEQLLIDQTPESIAPSGGTRPFQALLQELRGLAEFSAETVPQKTNEKAVTTAKTTEARISMQDGINSRADAIKALHEVAEFFRKTEPASPVPYFVERAARLVDRDFLGLLDELAPDAVPGFQNLAGVNRTDTNR